VRPAGVRIRILTDDHHLGLGKGPIRAARRASAEAIPQVERMLGPVGHGAYGAQESPIL
jgi:hypothetical protein